MLTFNFYIGVFLETYILFLLTDLSEIYYQNKNGVQNVLSTVLSYIILASMICFILLSFWQWCKSKYPESFRKQKYFRALIDGMKPKWICRSYWFVFLIRRSLFGVVIFFFENTAIIGKISIMVTIQSSLLLYILILRPFESIKDNISDIINEIFYLFYCVFLFYYNTEDRWNDTTTETYFWILMSNNFILILIVLIQIIKSVFFTLRSIYKKLRPISHTKVQILKKATTTHDLQIKPSKNINKMMEEEKEFASKDSLQYERNHRNFYHKHDSSKIISHRIDFKEHDSVHFDHLPNLKLEYVRHTDKSI